MFFLSKLVIFLIFIMKAARIWVYCIKPTSFPLFAIDVGSLSTIVYTGPHRMIGMICVANFDII